MLIFLIGVLCVTNLFTSYWLIRTEDKNRQLHSDIVSLATISRTVLDNSPTDSLLSAANRELKEFERKWNIKV